MSAKKSKQTHPLRCENKPQKNEDISQTETSGPTMRCDAPRYSYTFSADAR